MTWWAAALSFAGALMGTWGGQWIVTKREDLRWERERDREELRHSRELDRIHQQRQYDARVAWRTERASAYTSFLGSFEDWNRVFFSIDVGELPELRAMTCTPAELESSYTDVRHAAEALELMGSTNVTQHLEGFMTELFRLTVERKRMAELVERGAEVTTTRQGQRVEALHVIRDRIKDAARDDVLADIQDPQPRLSP